MLQRCLFFVFLSVFSGFLTASAQRSETPPWQVSEGVLMGTVIAPSGIPVSGAVVVACPDVQGGTMHPSRPLEVRTDRDGTFRLPLRFGRYQVRVSATGFLSTYENASKHDAEAVVLTAENDARWFGPSS